MKVGILVGQTDDGKFETIGKIGEIQPLNDKLREIVSNGGNVVTGKSEKHFVKLWLSNVAANPLKLRKC